MDRKSKRGTAVLYLLEVGQQARLRSTKTWEPLSHTVTMVKCYADLFLTATRGAVTILAYDGVTSTLNTVRVIGVHLGLTVSDFAAVEGSVMTVSEEDDCLHVASLDLNKYRTISW